MKTIVLYITLVFPFGQPPVLLENNEKFETIEQCQAVGKVKSIEVAQTIANKFRHSVQYRWWCEGEEKRSI